MSKTAWVFEFDNTLTKIDILNNIIIRGPHTVHNQEASIELDYDRFKRTIHDQKLLETGDPKHIWSGEKIYKTYVNKYFKKFIEKEIKKNNCIVICSYNFTEVIFELLKLLNINEDDLLRWGSNFMIISLSDSYRTDLHKINQEISQNGQKSNIKINIIRQLINNKYDVLYFDTNDLNIRHIRDYNLDNHYKYNPVENFVYLKETKIIKNKQVLNTYKSTKGSYYLDPVCIALVNTLLDKDINETKLLCLTSTYNYFFRNRLSELTKEKAESYLMMISKDITGRWILRNGSKIGISYIKGIKETPDIELVKEISKSMALEEEYRRQDKEKIRDKLGQEIFKDTTSFIPFYRRNNCYCKLVPDIEHIDNITIKQIEELIETGKIEADKVIDINEIPNMIGLKWNIMDHPLYKYLGELNSYFKKSLRHIQSDEAEDILTKKIFNKQMEGRWMLRLCKKSMSPVLTAVMGVNNMGETEIETFKSISFEFIKNNIKKNVLDENLLIIV